MKRFRVVISPAATDDIRAAYGWYLAENPVHAAEWLEAIRRAILALDTLPHAHAVAPESAAFDCEIRHLLCGRANRWRFFFSIDESTVHVLHVRHTSRDH